ncbi:hypothetical protein DUNSADRAFT_7918 [Dunaliella salina]|uniref:Pentatricopeptide repeat-containing protein n=1 Tax=Dunaliella salina TaxID=3046 RepID=A0ABQ7GKE8_DUNSA|nr:hypothetical protein DUNSADRAFT_7918 [Dunaliella salina]|eukprot:KAF5835068.1 hypothetical protein DUNSADRAFT_7918 [Dunaliella salina]
MCCRCDASDVMASALIHANEVGLPITYHCAHLAMIHWAQLMELPKMEQVLEAMPQGGLPFNPKTAYIIIRGAVNAGRQELAEAYAARMMANGVRLHHSVNMLLEIGRERAKQRVQAMQWSEDE